MKRGTNTQEAHITWKNHTNLKTMNTTHPSMNTKTADKYMMIRNTDSMPAEDRSKKSIHTTMPIETAVDHAPQIGTKEETTH